MTALLAALHALSATIWVGGMFFAYVVLRPAAAALEAPTRLALWQGVFSRFFPWVWASVVVLFATGYAMLFHRFGGFSAAPPHIHLMQLTGIVMALLFFYLFFVPWRRYASCVESKDFAASGSELGRIRKIVAVNLLLGLLTVAVGASGRFWP